MSSNPPSKTSTTSQTGHATQPSISEPATNGKRSWVWAFFFEISPQNVEFNLINPTGMSFRKKPKWDKTGITWSINDHLNALHHLTNPNSPSESGKGNNNNSLLEKFVIKKQSKK
ncbi:hypothetical protein O181_071735 [Austropuccinia psidii MF-1]|uniref:Uncharacterized protein n=1 Tax=Austropuccinia psidii MF-1 TaxID=1389203 RepID=A0A9Q3EZ29_9BASI|nr:hypothetical protein [Austropuccinia psidii MF-1]